MQLPLYGRRHYTEEGLVEAVMVYQEQIWFRENKPATNALNEYLTSTIASQTAEKSFSYKDRNPEILQFTCNVSCVSNLQYDNQIILKLPRLVPSDPWGKLLE